MAFQDDSREIEIRDIFGLTEPKNRSRQDVDGLLKVGKKNIEFELKSIQGSGSITTARDVGYNHLEKWKRMHWLVGVYNKNKFDHAYYIPPRVILPWIEQKEEYIRPDYMIANLMHEKLSIEEMFLIIGKKNKYSYKDAKSIQKNQHKKSEYESMMDLDNGYSPEAMLNIVRDRVRYLILRGYTLNNPHIPSKVMLAGYKIENNFSSSLIKLVKKELF